MRSHILTSALLSASRLYAASTSSAAPRLLSTASLLRTCSPPAARLFSTTSTCASPANSSPETPHTSPTMAANSTALLEAFKARRSYYQINKTLPIPAEKITQIVKDAVVQVPSSFNSQSNRVLVLHGAEHDKLWDITSETLKAIVPADSWEATAQRNAGFKAGAGTVLFFIETTAIKGMQERFALYKDRFPVWGEHSSAMLQFALWTSLEAEGLGASLQHYNPLIDARVASEWGVPESWTLVAQLVFGGRAGEAGPKDHLPTEETVKVAGL
ncbi:Nitroreductase-like protein [Xylaria intraflava]|nr:Nitroreductase-like protein [Xylaria intraflava]